jgi:hypothetical protein
MRRFRAPGEAEAEERTWAVVASAYAGRDATRARRRTLRPVLALVAVAVAVAALAAVAFTSPGEALITSVRKAIGVASARPALFSLPARGNVLAGGWLVRSDGSARRLGDYTQSSWSPFGHFVVAANRNELAALEPDGSIRWTLARPHVRFPRWAGGRTDTRVAYLSGSHLRIVAGDGTGDRPVAVAAHVAPSWREAASAGALALVYADPRGRVRAFEPASGRTLFRTAPGPVPTTLVWSDDGGRLLVVAPRRLRIYDLRGRLTTSVTGTFRDASFLPGTRRVAVLSVRGHDSVVSLLGAARPLFRTTGRLAQVVPSPDARWLLVTWPQADQWLFLRVAGKGRLRAVGDISEQLGGSFAVDGWCCRR